MNALLALVAVLGVSASGPLMAGIAAPALAIAFWRNALAEVVLIPVAGATRRSELARLSAREVRLTMLSGLMLAAHFGTWVSSLKLTSVASATALVCLQVGWVVLIGRVRGHHITRAVLAGLAVSFSGVLVVSGVDVTISSDAVTGDLLAFAGGFFAAVYTWMGSAVRQSLTTTTYTVLCYGTCAFILGLACLVSGQSLSGYAASTWWGIVAVTVAAQLLGHTIFNRLLAVMSPTVVSLVLLLEVPGAALLAAVFLAQAPPAGVYVGLLLIIGGLAVVVARREEPALVEAPVD